MDPYEFSIQKVKEVGATLLDARERGFSVATKGGNPRDIVTSIDKKANDILVSAIKKEFPTHRLYSEEGGDVVAGSDEQWVIDPIDGSANFSRGIPHFSVCLGLLKGGAPVAGAVYNPVTKELFSFKKGEGAFLNGNPIGVSGVSVLAEAQVVFSPGSRKPELWDWAAVSYRKLLEKSLKRGMYGSSALDICFVAAGRADVGVYGTLSTLDIAAALGILQEAGGVSASASGGSLEYSIASQKVYIGNSTPMLEELRVLLES
ncbi:MAG: inositol monophosphatase 1-like [Parcubacteria group bacterium Gr01-1014_56]|nr:MAG: inositol monophosphatase 1-like [Parcubacteria group bacterium Gr01-1014_56]